MFCIEYGSIAMFWNGFHFSGGRVQAVTVEMGSVYAEYTQTKGRRGPGSVLLVPSENCVPEFLFYVLSLLRSSWQQQAVFPSKNIFREFCEYMIPAEILLVVAGVCLLTGRTFPRFPEMG